MDYLRVGGSSSQIHKEIEKHTISHLTSDVRSVSYLKDVYERKVRRYNVLNYVHTNLYIYT